MNKCAGLVGSSDFAATREQRLRRALAGSSPVSVQHLSPNVSVGWAGDAGLTTLAQEQNSFAFVHGHAYCIGDSGELSGPRTRAIERLAKYLLSCHDPKRPRASYAGAFMALVESGGQLQLMGDPSGGRSPYYSIQGSSLSFANHPLICARLQDSASIDRGLEDFLLLYGFLPDGRTVYQQVRQLSQNKCVERGPDGWKLASIAPSRGTDDFSLPESRDALSNELYEVMLRCTEDQLTDHTEVGVLLGGFDSALVAAILQRLGKQVRTYSFRYPDSSYDQPHTDTLSRYLGCTHTWVDISPDIIATGLERYGEHYVQPTNWLNYVIQTTHVGQQMRKDGLEQAYSGDGCDALFLGYPGTYRRTRTFSNLPRLPTPLIKVAVALLGSTKLDRSLGHPYRVGMNLVRAMQRPLPDRAFLTFRILDEVSLKALRVDAGPAQDEATEAILARLASPYADLSIQRIGYAAKALVSPNRAKMLAFADVAGVGVFAPYLHPTLRAFTARVPDHLLRESGQFGLSDPGKICLMEMARKHRLLPEEVIRQPKLAAIDSPIDDWFDGPLRRILHDSLQGLPFSADPRYLRALSTRTLAERIYKDRIGSTQVISDAISLLATYAAACGALQESPQ